MLSLSQTALVRYVLAVLLSGVGIFLTAQSDMLTIYVCLPLSLVAVMVATYFGGRIAGVLSLIFSAITVKYFIIPPTHSFNFDVSNAIQFGAFLFAGSLIVLSTKTFGKSEVRIADDSDRDDLILENSPLIKAIDAPEAASTESELLKAFANCPIAVTVNRFNGGGFVDVNAEFTELTGWARDEVLGRTVVECGLVDVGTELELRARLTENRGFADQEFEIKTRSGDTLHVRVGVAFVELRGERHVVSTFVNNAERRQSDAELLASEERLHLVTENALVGLVMISEDRRYIFANPRFADILGLPTANIVGCRVSDIHPRLYEKQIGPSLDRVFAGESVRNELRQEMPDGDHFFDVRYEPTTVDGSVSSVVAVITDITDRNRAELAREASEERYRTLFEYSPDGILISNPDSYYVDANESICEMLGYERDEVIGSHATNIVVPKDIPHLAVTLLGLNDDFEYYREWQLRRRDASVFPVEVTATKMPDGNTLTVIRDTTDRKHLENQLLQSQKMEAIGVLAGGLAHDFNNILTAIAGYSDLTLENMSADDPLRHYVVGIRDAGVRAAALTNQLLAFSRKRVLLPSVYNLNLAVTETEKMLRRVVKENIEFRIKLNPELSNVKADPGQIGQVIVNLVINSGDAMPNGGTLTIETRNVHIDNNFPGSNIAVVPGQFVELTIADTGFGMDDETQRRLFEPFFTTKEVGKGTGLGLSTAYGIIKQSGGDITVESEPGRGSTFKVYLPCVDEAVSYQPVSPRNSEPTSGFETILLVEDEVAVRILVNDILIRNGYTVLKADSGEAALKICKEYPNQIHLLLSDMIMPKMGGRELKDEVVKIRPNVRVLFMSGYTGDSIAKDLPGLSGSAFLEKPFTPDELVSKVRETLTADDMLSDTADEDSTPIQEPRAAHSR